MLFMVVERFKGGDPTLAGERFQRLGRLLPPGVEYVTSWMTPGGDRCFQVMDAPDCASLDAWTTAWDDLVEFEVVEIVTSHEFWAGKAAC